MTVSLMPLRITLRAVSGRSTCINGSLIVLSGCSVPTDELLCRRIEYAISGHVVWALSDADRLIHATLHLASSRGPYRRLSG